jgi:RNA polymerase sigma-70 factor (ECF subfamily)
MKSDDPADVSMRPSNIEEALSTISDAGWIRLRKASKFLSYGRLDPDDLLQNALITVLEGRRRRPPELDAIRLITGTMRSLASSEIKSLKRMPEVHVLSSGNGEDKPRLDPEDERPNAEQEIVSFEETATIRAAIVSLFDGDEMAQIIIKGDMEGVDAKELYDLTGLDKTAYASKRRLIRRRIEHAYPEGWKQ